MPGTLAVRFAVDSARDWGGTAIRDGHSLRFALHSDDMVGSTSSQAMLDDLKACLTARWPDLKMGGWGDVLGFATVRAIKIIR